MKSFTLADVVNATDGTLVSGRPHMQVCGVSTDTRTIKKGQLFVALRGDRFDGHDFLSAAVDNGAAAVMVSEPSQIGNLAVATIVVPNTLIGLQGLARWSRLAFDIPVIGVTGSCGKTTVKELIAAVLGTRFCVTKTPLNFNNEIGVPLSLLSLSEATEVAVIELGSNAPGEMRVLCDVARPNRALITNIGRTHLEGFGTVQAVAREKAELVKAVGERGTFYVNADDRFCVRIAQEFAGRRVTFGTNQSADWRAMFGESRFDLPMSMFTIEGVGSFNVPLIGKHNVMNAVAAAAVGLDFGLNRAEIQDGLSGAELPPLRTKVVSMGGRVFLNDAYNANPESMRAAIETVVSWQTTGRKIAVLGDMLELGGASANEHEELGAFAARAKISLLLVFGEYAARVAEGAFKGGLDKNSVFVCKSHAEIARNLVNLSVSGDVILVKGSRAVAMEKVLDEVRAFLE